MSILDGLFGSTSADSAGSDGLPPGLLSGGSTGGGGAFGLPPGLLSPDLQSYAKRQALMGLAQGLLKAGAPSFTPKSFGSVAADAGGGVAGGLQSGVDNALKLQQVMMQRAGLSATYQALAPKVGPQAALLYAMHPDLLASQIKPIAEQPGGKIVAPLSFNGGGAGGEPAPAAGPLSPTLAAAVHTATGAPGGVPAPATVPAGNGGSATSGGNGGMAVLDQNTNGLLGPDALSNMVQQRLLGDTSPEKSGAFGGMGPLGKLNNARYQTALSAAMQQQGITPAELSRRTAAFPSYSKTYDTLVGLENTMGTARREFANIWPNFMQALKEVNSSQFPTWNAAKQYIAEHKGDPSVAPIAGYLNGLENTYVRAVATGKQGATEGAHARFDEVLNQYWNTAQMQNAGKALGIEMLSAKNSMPQQEFALKKKFGLAGKDEQPEAPDTLNPLTGERVMPSPPSALIGKAGLVYNPARRLWRDGQGKLYKIDGTPVQ